jgi:phosphoesterase RecJ-like protein
MPKTQNETERKKIRKALEAGGSFVLAAHRRPDGDALGSMLALARWIEGRGGIAAVVCPGGVPEPYGFLPGAESVVRGFPIAPAQAALIVVDTPMVSRTGAPPELVAQASPVINIDHHPDNEEFGDANLVDTSASAAALLVYEILEPLGGLASEIASLLYVGIFTDTGGFRFGNTDARTLATAARLVELGADPALTARMVYGEQPLGRLRLLGLVLASAETVLDGRVAVLTLTDEMRRETGSSGDEIEGLAAYGRHIEGAQVSALLRELDGAVRVSLRSAGPVDVNAVAASLGGGGHRAAAGIVMEGSLEEARGRLIEAIEEFLV